MAVKDRLHRSQLAVPGSNLRMLEKAPDAGADIVFLDLEDAVAPADKDQARENVIQALNTYDWSKCAVDVPDTACHWYITAPDSTMGEGFSWANAPWFSAEGLLDIGELHNTVQSLQEA